MTESGGGDDQGGGKRRAAAGTATDPFRATFERAPVGLAHVGPDGSWLAVNDRLCEIVGYAREELLAVTFQAITHPADLETDLTEVRRMLAGEIDRYQMQKRYVRRDGTALWVLLTVSLVRDAATGGPQYFVSVVEDIDAQKRAEAARTAAEAALSESERRFRALVEGVKDYALFMTDPEGVILSWNPGVGRVLGWGEEIVGQHIRVIFTPEDQEAGAPDQEMATALREGRASDERWHMRKDGSRFWATGVVHPVRDEATGALIGFSKVMSDATERHEQERRIAEYAAQQRRIAETVQRSLLMVPPPDAFPGLTVKPLYESASDDALIGGDFFDLFAIAEDTVALVIGDATGHGIEAVTYTAEVKFALRAYLREYPHPAVALERLNGFIAEKERLDPAHLGGSYVALSVCVVNTRTGEVACSWGGIEPPFIARAGASEGEAAGEAGAVLQLAECGGPLLGVEPNTKYGEQRATLGGGDVLALSTDGLTEARRGRGRQREFFGYDGLVRAVREEAVGAASLGDAAASVAQRARAFAGGTINDDVCLLLARRL